MDTPSMDEAHRHIAERGTKEDRYTAWFYIHAVQVQGKVIDGGKGFNSNFFGAS